MQLYEINQNGNKYCGPSAISAIAGIGTKEAAAILREETDKEAIKGTHGHEVVKALYKLGFDSKLVGQYPRGKRVNLRQWAKDHARGDDVFLVAAGNHWVLVQGRYAMCGKTKNLVAIADHPNVRTFVADARLITKARTVDPQTVIPKKTLTETGARMRAYNLARKHGIQIEPGEDRDSSICVWQARGHHDPYMDGHYFGDWREVLQRVQEYADLQARANEPAVLSEEAAKTASRELARKHGIDVAQEADGDDRAKWVTPPKSIAKTPADPFESYRINGPWQEVLARVQAYAEIIEGKPIEAPLTESTARTRAQELAENQGKQLEQDNQRARTIWIYPPEEFDEDKDEYTDTHYAYTWREALEHVQFYANVLAAAT
jgi:hypothetical protein